MTKTYKEYLEGEGLSPETIRVYTSVINNLQKQMKKTNKKPLDLINTYLKKRTIKGRAYYTRYAIAHYLKHKGKETTIPKLPKPKITDTDKEPGTYIPRNKINKILSILRNYPDKKYYILAIIQAYCGTRPQETIKLKKANIKQNPDKSLLIELIGKGGYKRATALYPPLSNAVWAYVENRGVYPFINQKINDINDEHSMKVTKTIYHRYYTLVQEAAQTINITGFKPHDFRRNFAEDLKNKDYPIHIIQQALGHKSLMTTTIYFRKDISTFSPALKELYK